MAEISRNQEHIVIMTVIYNELIDFKFGDNTFVRDAKQLIADFYGADYDDVPAFVKDTVMISLQKYGEIVNAYFPYLRDWKWERLPLLTQAILLMSYTHFNYIEKVDKKIIINIAVNLAKKYIDDKQAKFINAILDSGVLNGRK